MRERDVKLVQEREVQGHCSPWLYIHVRLVCKNMQCKERGMVEGRDIAVLMSSLKPTKLQ